MKVLLALLILIPTALVAQTRVIGMVTNETDDAVGFCHVYNQTMGLGIISDMNGNFTITARKGDSIAFSYVGYQSLTLAVSSVHLANFLKITLPEDSILLPAITIYADPNYRVPLRVTGEPIFVPGVSLVNPPEPIQPGDVSLGAVGVGNVPVPAVSINGPITYFSKDEQEKRKAAEATEETRKTITYQVYIAQDSVREKLSKLYRLSNDEYDQVIVRLHQQFPGIQKQYSHKEIWNWLLFHFDRTAPLVKDF